MKVRSPLSLVSLLAALLVSLPGCVSPDQAKPMPGQLSYRTTDTMGLIGDVVVVPGEPFQLNFFKGPGDPLLRIENSGVYGSASGSMAGPGWSGRVAEAPDQLASWLALRSAFKGPDTGAARNPNQPSFTVERDYDGSRLIGMTVSFMGTGEKFNFRFD